MTPSSADAREASTGAADPGQRVTVARFDRPLSRSGTGDHGVGWADPAVEERIARAEQRACEHARSLGYAAGWAQGRQAAAEQERIAAQRREQEAAEAMAAHTLRARRLVQGLTEELRRAGQSCVPAWEELGDAIADGALAIARAALGRELAAIDVPVLDAVRTALRRLGGPADVVIHVHPGDLALLRGGTAGDLPEGLRLVADPELAPGTVRALGVAQRLLLDLPAAVARAEEVLRP